MSEDTYFYGHNGEDAFFSGLDVICYSCGTKITVKIEQSVVDSIVKDEKVSESHARSIAFDRYKSCESCEWDGTLRSSYVLRFTP